MNIARVLKPRPQPPERSPTLRALASLAAAISLVAFAWVGGDLLRAALLVLLTGAGHMHSWRRASDINSLVRLLILLSIVAMTILSLDDLRALFSGGLLLSLARWMATAQAISSFGLQTRRNLYDSLVLSLAVLLLLGEQALSMSFLVFLLAFATVVLLFLIVSHVSSSSEDAERVAFPRFGAAVGLGGMTIAATLVLAVFVYLAVPHNHTVISAGPLPSRLDVTSGWPPPPLGVPEGDWAPWADFLPDRDFRATLGGGSGGASLERIGQYVTLGYTDDREKDVVLRVRSPLASFWRGYTVDRYDGRGWVADNQLAGLLVDRSGRLRFAEAPTRFPRGKTYVQTYFLKVRQPSSVFTAYSPGWLALGASGAGEGRDALRENLEYLQEASIYRTISPLPHLTPDLLALDRADRSDPSLLATPPIPERVRRLAEEIVEGATTDYERAARIERFLLTQYPYDLRVPPYPEDGDAVDVFLFEVQKGYCSQFATAMAIMGRLVGLPTRVAVGYLPGRYNSFTGVHEVRTQDAHAWVEVKFRRHGWVAFDPTPSPNSPWALGFGDTGLAVGLQQILRTGFLGLMMEAPSRAFGNVATPLAALGVGTALAVAVAMAFLVLRRARPDGVAARGSFTYSRLAGTRREEMRRVYRQAVEELQRRGQPLRLAHQTPYEYAESVVWSDGESKEAFRQLSEWVAKAAYDPVPLPEELLKRARELMGRLAR